MSKRVFTAIDIENKNTLDTLTRIRDRLNLGFKPVKRDKMHITLEFFQDLDDKELELLEKHLNSVKQKKFTLKIKGINCFPSKDYIRVVWAGVKGNQIKCLHDRVSDHNIEQQSEHEFIPHVTLFRVKNPTKNQKTKLKKQINEYMNQEFGKISVNEFKLYESLHKSNSTKYKLIESYELV